jgi:ElaA protein
MSPTDAAPFEPASWPGMSWSWSRFDELSLRQLQHIFAVRQRVFVVEQECVFLDIDGCDERARHLAAWSTGQEEPVGYARVLEPGVKYDEVSIGRVVTCGSGRGCGLGREVVRRAIGGAAAVWPGAAIRISAQSRLERFYAEFGFVVVGGRYLEDGIDHTEMVLAGTT